MRSLGPERSFYSLTTFPYFNFCSTFPVDTYLHYFECLFFFYLQYFQIIFNFFEKSVFGNITKSLLTGT